MRLLHRHRWRVVNYWFQPDSYVGWQIVYDQRCRCGDKRHVLG